MDFEDHQGNFAHDYIFQDAVRRTSSRHRKRSNGNMDRASGGELPPRRGYDFPLGEDELITVLDILLDKESQRFQKSNELISVDRRVNLSQESFNMPDDEPTDSETIGNFRLVCQYFNEIGARYQCSRVTTRFSESGLRRLENIASSPTLSRNVLKFSYMVPCFYEPGEVKLSNLSKELLDELQNQYYVPINDYQQRIDERRHVVARNLDIYVLKKAFKAFRRLQHVQLLRVQDSLDRRMYEFCRNREAQTAHIIRPDHNAAYLRSILNIARALVDSESPCDRFSSPHLNPESAMYLAGDGLGRLPVNMASVVWKLRALELMFTGGPDMDQRINNLAESFNRVMRSAINLKAFHVGFGGHSELPGLPIGTQFEAVFHDVHWQQLGAFGIDGWRINAQDIINLTWRHRDKLKGLRLRNVYLNEGSKWKTVLAHLRSNLTLKWVSLKGIGYASQFASFRPDNFTWDPSSDEESETDDEETEEDDTRDDDNDADTNLTDDMDDDQLYENHNGRRESINGENGTHTMLDLISDDPDVLGDDGEFVDPENRKFWQKWVTRGK